ncbi:MAG: polysaccharide deacetylase family protein [Acidimicrobiales bacterium]
MKPVPKGAVILAYHNVVEDGATQKPGIDELTVTESQLRSHVRLIRMLRLQVVDLSHIARVLASGDDPTGLITFTFDDALAGVARVGLPVLNDAGISSTIFVPTDRPGEPPEFWPGAERTMSTDELRAAVAHGHALGSHTASHRSLVTLDRADLDDELRRSRRALEDLTDDPVRSIAYPSGHHNLSVRQAVLDAGYQSACTFLNGRATGDVDPLRLPRFTMGAHSSSARFLYHLARPAGSWPDHQLAEVGGPPSA